MRAKGWGKGDRPAALSGFQEVNTNVTLRGAETGACPVFAAEVRCCRLLRSEMGGKDFTVPRTAGRYASNRRALPARFGEIPRRIRETQCLETPQAPEGAYPAVPLVALLRTSSPDRSQSALPCSAESVRQKSESSHWAISLRHLTCGTYVNPAGLDQHPPLHTCLCSLWPSLPTHDSERVRRAPHAHCDSCGA